VQCIGCDVCHGKMCCDGLAAGVAYWEHDYLNGATKSDNLVRTSDSTWTNILQPAAQAVAQKVAALPVVNGCVPSQLYGSCFSLTSLDSLTYHVFNIGVIGLSVSCYVSVFCGCHVLSDVGALLQPKCTPSGFEQPACSQPYKACPVVHVWVAVRYRH